MSQLFRANQYEPARAQRWVGFSEKGEVKLSTKSNWKVITNHYFRRSSHKQNPASV